MGIIPPLLFAARFLLFQRSQASILGLASSISRVAQQTLDECSLEQLAADPENKSKRPLDYILAQAASN